GTAWPLLLLASAAVGSVWRWIDPWDGAARLLERGEPGTETATDVRWAVIPALAWVWYVAAYPNSLSPRAVGTALALYTIVTVMGCLAVGRTVWMSRVEVFGLLFGWATRLPLGRLGVWRPPRGTELVLGVLGGGFLFGSIRGSELWGALNVGPLAGLLATIGLVATCTLAAATLTALARRASRRGVPGSVAAAAVPMVVAVGLNLAMARGRLLVSIQLLPRLAGDPFGRGWDLFGTGGGLPPSSPLGPEALAATQVAILMVGGIVGAIVAGMRTSRAVRGPALAGVTLLGAGAVLAISAT
ncbi:MAG TPA: hypothetical protein VG602_08440, partial [Actinomycetota bacterium]|nr:hypothetical protein [Actinomycetota bacterium]